MKHDAHFRTAFTAAFSSLSKGGTLFGFSASHLLKEVYEREIYMENTRKKDAA